MAQPLISAKYVQFVAVQAEEYRVSKEQSFGHIEGLRMDEAMNPQQY